MSKTINFELSKRLNDLWLLDEIETEYIYWINTKWEPNISKIYNHYNWIDKLYPVEYYKTLTLEEAIEFLPKELILNWNNCNPYFNNTNCWYSDSKYNIIHREKWKNIIEAIQKMIEYLLNNNLLWKKKEENT